MLILGLQSDIKMMTFITGKNAKYAESVNAEEEEQCATVNNFNEVDIPVHQEIFDISDKPFCAIRQQLLPEKFDNLQEIYDEFGFSVEDATNHSCSTEIETPQQRMKWLAHIEFSHDDIQDELTWSKVNVEKLDPEKTLELVREFGISHSLRPFLWPRFCGALKKKEASSYAYADVVRQCDMDKPSVVAQIEKDLLRTLPNNVCFWQQESQGIDSLRRVLRSVAYMYPDVGYCQGMGVIVAMLLLFCPEEIVFWIMATFIEDIFPANYYNGSLLGVQADVRVTMHLMDTHIPEVAKLLRENEVDTSLITVNWLLTAFGSVFPIRMLLRIWDFLFVSGGIAIFRTFIAMLKLKEEEFLSVTASKNLSIDIFNILASVPTSIQNPEDLVEMYISFEFSISPELIASMRKRQQAILLADEGLIVNPNTDTNLPKQRVHKRQLQRSTSILSQMLPTTLTGTQVTSNSLCRYFLKCNIKFDKVNSKGASVGYWQLFIEFLQAERSDLRMKNVHQTEMIVDLREAVLQICRHFINCDDSFKEKITLQANYIMEPQKDEIEQFLKAKRQGHRRARALLDFERQDEDELGFKKNDMITILSEKDEHCWIGEVNGLQGWFPAKFVEVVDERGKNYTIYGDEAVYPEITELIRDRLTNAIKPILEHGLRRSLMLNFSNHPWYFIESLLHTLSVSEEIAQGSVRSHYSSVHSRLTLCSTFSLDQDGKILTPEELLYRSVEHINDTHNAIGASLDAKLRSLIVMGVNEQCLHLWFDILCGNPSQDFIRTKYYHSWSFIKSPIWRQVTNSF
uniref:RUN and TBC1 domain-containing protein 3 n=1 Tax=Syphacia muris TaxID=451379 RepID=A0A0N5AIJ5_9BILA